MHAVYITYTDPRETDGIATLVSIGNDSFVHSIDAVCYMYRSPYSETDGRTCK